MPPIAGYEGAHIGTSAPRAPVQDNLVQSLVGRKDYIWVEAPDLCHEFK